MPAQTCSNWTAYSPCSQLSNSKAASHLTALQSVLESVKRELRRATVGNPLCASAACSRRGAMQIAHSERIPPAINGVPTDVVQVHNPRSHHEG
jgi:hypothetical protein